jgi:hypothetical protein
MSSAWNNVCNFFKSHNKRLSSGDLVLIEERIYGEYQNFIFVDGTSHDKCPELLIAFVHFSYHKSEGKLVICDLQGAIDDSNNYFLTVLDMQLKTVQLTLNTNQSINQEIIFKYQ